MKSQLIAREVTWVGRKISEHGVTFDDSLIEGLQNLSPPTNAQELQQFVCGVNWMRCSIPNFAEEIAPLQDVIRTCQQQLNSSKGSRLRKIPLEWTPDLNSCFLRIKELLKNIVRLAHPNSHKDLCLYTDASDFYWGVTLTQVETWDLKKSVSDQSHEPLAFLSGQFTGKWFMTLIKH